MTRTKNKPPLRKPLFDEDEVCRFAAMGGDQGGDAGHAAGGEAGGPVQDRKPDRKSGSLRPGLTIQFEPEIVARLRAEAERKGKTVDQIVEKLVIKHLRKH